MPDLPQKKVGIVACSGEEMAEGTVTRLAALKVLEQLRPDDTVTICLPLFLAGGEGDRAFARFYPTIAVDGCDARCAARATEQYSGKPAASVVVTDLIAERGLARPQGRRRLDEAGRTAVEERPRSWPGWWMSCWTRHWSRREGHFIEDEPAMARRSRPARPRAAPAARVSRCSQVGINGKKVTLIALPPLMDQF